MLIISAEMFCIRCSAVTRPFKGPASSTRETAALIERLPGLLQPKHLEVGGDCRL